MVINDFESLGLMPSCLQALVHEGYTSPTPIQVQAIPPLLAGKDLLGCAQTGTGKTAAFALPLIQRLVQNPSRLHAKQVRALVIAPTRELAAQIDASFAAYGRHSHLQRACIFGGVGKVPQIRALSRGVDVLVATPGRLLDLNNDGALTLAAVEMVVFDEADRMLDMGFIHDVRRIIALLPKKRQTLLFSATMPAEIEQLANSLLLDPVRIAIEPEKPAVESIQQSLYFVEKGAKRDLLVQLIKDFEVSRAIVFSRTKHGADRIARGLHTAGIEAGVIHANKGQGNRTRTMDAFRNGESRILVATDIAARGIDVDEVSHVFNFDLPTEPETYVHRIGRTARAGNSGVAVSFCDTEEKKLLRQIERLLGKSLPVIKDHAFAGVRHHHNATESEPETRERSGPARQRPGSGNQPGGSRNQSRADGGRGNRTGRKPGVQERRPAAQERGADTPARAPSGARPTGSARGSSGGSSGARRGRPEGTSSTLRSSLQSTRDAIAQVSGRYRP